MSKLPPLRADLDPVYLPYGRKSHAQERKDQRLTEREQRDSTLTFTAEHIRRAGRGELAPVAWEFDAKTGLTDKRESYQRRLSEARAYRAEGRKVYVVVRQVDRLGRDAEEQHRCDKELRRLDCTLLAVDMGGEISEEVLPYLIANAKVGSLKIAANVRRINAQVRRDGWWRPARTPWGYDVVPTTPAQRAQGAPKVTLSVNEAQAKRVREAFAAVVKGDALHRIGRWLATLPEADRGHVTTKDGQRPRVLTPQALRLVLRSRIYAAQQPNGDPGRWPAIVDVATWEAAQEALDGVKRALPKQASGAYLLTGLIWCPACQAAGGSVRMTGWHRRGTGASPRYQCRATEAGANAPRACYYSVATPLADADVRRQVAPIITLLATERRAAVLREVGAMLREATAGPAADVQARLATVQAKIDTAKAGRRKLMQALAAELISDEEFREEVGPFRAELAAAEAERDAIMAGAGGPGDLRFRGRAKLTVAAVARQLDRAAALWQSDPGTAEQRQFLAELVARIVPERTGPGQVTCHLEWTEEGAALLAAAAAIGVEAGEEPAGEAADEAAAG